MLIKHNFYQTKVKVIIAKAFSSNRKQKKNTTLIKMMNKIVLLILAVAVVVSPSLVDAKRAERTCRRGAREGKRAIKKLWKDLGSDCENAWTIRKQAEDKILKRKNFKTTNRSTPRQITYATCATESVETMIETYEENCFGPSAEECEEVAEFAASVIVNEVCSMANDTEMSFAALAEDDEIDYLGVCSEVATFLCPSKIEPMLKDYCSGDDFAKFRRIPELVQLMRMCEEKMTELVDLEQ